MSRIIIALSAVLICQVYARGDLTDFSVITTKGYVSYTVESDWKVLSMRTQPPKTAALFQIPNPADNGTPDSTNLTLMTFERDSVEASATFTKLAGKLRSDGRHEKHKQWDVFAQEAKQDSTDYSIRDAFREVPGAFVMIRIAWPHLKQNPKDFDSRMEALFHSLLDSVSGGIGPKPKKEGEVIRRPIEQ